MVWVIAQRFGWNDLLCGQIVLRWLVERCHGWGIHSEMVQASICVLLPPWTCASCALIWRTWSICSRHYVLLLLGQLGADSSLGYWSYPSLCFQAADDLPRVARHPAEVATSSPSDFQYGCSLWPACCDSIGYVPLYSGIHQSPNAPRVPAVTWRIWKTNIVT